MSERVSSFRPSLLAISHWIHTHTIL